MWLFPSHIEGSVALSVTGSVERPWTHSRTWRLLLLKFLIFVLKFFFFLYKLCSTAFAPIGKNRLALKLVWKKLKVKAQKNEIIVVLFDIYFFCLSFPNFFLYLRLFFSHQYQFLCVNTSFSILTQFEVILFKKKKDFLSHADFTFYYISACSTQFKLLFFSHVWWKNSAEYHYFYRQKVSTGLVKVQS